MLAAVFSLSTIQSAYAQPGPLSNTPLFLSILVEPNLYFSYDDSGSMVWDALYEDGVADITTSEGLPYIKINNNLEEVGFLVRQWDRNTANKAYIPPANGNDPDGWPAEWEKGWPIFTHDANKIYYNPGFTYTPWVGLNEDGTPMYQDADPRAVQKHPWGGRPGTRPWISPSFIPSRDASAAKITDLRNTGTRPITPGPIQTTIPR